MRKGATNQKAVDFELSKIVADSQEIAIAQTPDILIYRLANLGIVSNGMALTVLILQSSDGFSSLVSIV